MCTLLLQLVRFWCAVLFACKNGYKHQVAELGVTAMFAWTACSLLYFGLSFACVSVCNLTLLRTKCKLCLLAIKVSMTHAAIVSPSSLFCLHAYRELSRDGSNISLCMFAKCTRVAIRLCMSHRCSCTTCLRQWQLKPRQIVRRLLHQSRCVCHCACAGAWARTCLMQHTADWLINQHARDHDPLLFSPL